MAVVFLALGAYAGKFDMIEPRISFGEDQPANCVSQRVAQDGLSNGNHQTLEVVLSEQTLYALYAPYMDNAPSF